MVDGICFDLVLLEELSAASASNYSTTIKGVLVVAKEGGIDGNSVESYDSTSDKLILGGTDGIFEGP